MLKNYSTIFFRVFVLVNNFYINTGAELYALKSRLLFHVKQIKLATIYTGYFAIAYRVYLGVSEQEDAIF